VSIQTVRHFQAKGINKFLDSLKRTKIQNIHGQGLSNFDICKKYQMITCGNTSATCVAAMVLAKTMTAGRVFHAGLSMAWFKRHAAAAMDEPCASR
jgi:hypothetical protein